MPYYVSIGRAIIDENQQRGGDNPPIIVTYKTEDGPPVKQWRVHGIGVEGSASFHTWQGGDAWRPLSVGVWAQIHPPFTMTIRNGTEHARRLHVETDPPPGELLQP